MPYDFKDSTVSYFVPTETGDDYEACKDGRHPNIHTREGTGQSSNQFLPLDLLLEHSMSRGGVGGVWGSTANQEGQINGHWTL